MDNVGVYSISGSVQYSLSSSLAHSLHASGSLNIRRAPERNLYRDILTGKALRSAIGQAPIPIYVSTVGTGTISSSFQSFGVQTATPPSWTQANTQTKIPIYHGFVLTPFSGAAHEVSRLNAYISGTAALERTPVPASATLFYSKATRLVRKLYSVTASIDLPVNPPTFERFPATDEYQARSVWDPTSGSYRNNSFFNPAVININIPDQGTIRDIRVWVELIHDHRGGPGTGTFGGNPFLFGGATGDPNSYPKQGLQGLQLALRSPNVSFLYAHPLWNAPTVSTFLKNTDQNLTGTVNQFAQKFQLVPPLLQGSYLLWAGHACENDLGVALGSLTASYPYPAIGSGGGLDPSVPSNAIGGYAEYDTDIDMRTIFWDGSSTPNPRHLDVLFPNATSVAPGNPNSSTGVQSLIINVPKYPAPSSASIVQFGFNTINTGSNPVLAPHVSGLNFPWMLDARVPPGNFVNRVYNALSGTTPSQEIIGGQLSNFYTLTASIPPPAGWLTGPAGANGFPTANVNEFPTFGMQLGPQTIKGVYPLLDDIYVQKIFDQPTLQTITFTFVFFNPFLGRFQTFFITRPVFTPPANRPSIVGFRPGLRGSQINGNWQLLIGTAGDYDPINGVLANQRAGVWFRQVRLEFIIDQGVEQFSFYPSKQQRFKRPSYVATTDGGSRRVQILSGSAGWDIGVNYVSTVQDPAYGRTIGITDSTGSAGDQYAVFTQITGVFADILSSASFGFGIYKSFLNNPTGRPYIPLSSGSGIPPSIDVRDPQNALIAKNILNQVLRPRTLTPLANTTKATLSRLNYTQTTRANVLNQFQAFDNVGFSAFPTLQDRYVSGSLLK